MNTERDLNITGASVKVMRSHDYCHFEVCLSSDSARTTTDVDDLRKEAARLADKAVEQYRVAKRWASKMEFQGGEEKEKRLESLAQIILEVPEHERTPEEKGILKGLADERYAKRQYDYQDDWDDNLG